MGSKLVSICSRCVEHMEKAGYVQAEIVQEGKRCWRCATKEPFWYWFYVPVPDM